jgi:predicted Zn-dependent protease
LEQAKREASAGEGEQAAATLERALDIEPRNPWLWHRLAVLRLQQGFWKEALHLATKSNTLAEGNNRLLGGNWEVIARALARLGDDNGAYKAKLNSQTYFERVGSW